MADYIQWIPQIGDTDYPNKFSLFMNALDTDMDTLQALGVTTNYTLADGRAIEFGDGTDLSIYHSGTAGYITQVTAQGDLIISNGANDLTIGELLTTFDLAVTITSGDLTLSAGALTMTLGDLTLTDGDLVLSSGALNMTLGDLTLTDGDLTLASGNVLLNSGSITLSQGNPQVRLYETDQIVGERAWQIQSSGKVFYMQSLTDAYSTGTSFIQASRGTGQTIDSLSLTATNVNAFGDFTINNASPQMNANASSGNASYYLRDTTTSRGLFYWDRAADTIYLRKYDTNGTTIVGDLGISNTGKINVRVGTFQLAGTDVTATASELNYNDGITLGQVAANKTVTADNNGNITFDTTAAGHSLRFKTATKESYLNGAVNGDIGMYNIDNAKYIWVYDTSLDTLDLPSDIVNIRSTPAYGMHIYDIPVNLVSGSATVDPWVNVSNTGLATAQAKKVILRVFAEASSGAATSLALDVWVRKTGSAMTAINTSKASTGSNARGTSGSLTVRTSVSEVVVSLDANYDFEWYTSDFFASGASVSTYVSIVGYYV